MLPPQKECGTSKIHFGSLDGLRAYAMICIIIMHVKAFLPYNHARIIGSFSHFVLLFMVVSAFSMCCGYYKRIKEGSISPSQFYKRRYLRILPYFAFLCLLEFAIHPNLTAFYELFTNMTLCFGLLPNPQIDMMSLGWFLGVVFFFYLLFPFFIFLMDNRRRALFSFVISLVFAFIAIAHFYNPPFVEQSPQMHNIIYCMPFFCMGGIIYLNRDKISFLYGLKKKSITFLTLLLSVCYFILRARINNEYTIYVLELIQFSIWVMYAISAENVFLSNHVTKFLSKISLEMYLTQMVVFRGVQLLHLEKYIVDDTLLYIFTSILVLVLVVPFTYITKIYFVDKVVNRYIH